MDVHPVSAQNSVFTGNLQGKLANCTFFSWAEPN